MIIVRSMFELQTTPLQDSLHGTNLFVMDDFLQGIPELERPHHKRYQSKHEQLNKLGT